MRNMKLASKLALGFGILLALALLLGGISVWQTGKVGRNSDHLSAEDVPMVKSSMDALEDLNLARYEIRAYGLTGEESHRMRGLAHIEGTQAHLKVALVLAEKYLDMAGMRENIRRAMEKMAEYSALVTETASREKAIHAIHARQDASAGQFVGNSEKYMANQHRKLDALIQKNDTVSNLAEQEDALKMRVLKVRIANDIADAGNRLYIANWKSQAQRDSGLGQAVMKDFDVISKKIAELLSMTTQQDDKELLGALKIESEQYRVAMNEYASNFTSLVELEKKCDSASDAAVEAVSVNAAECMRQIASTAARSSTTLSQASRITITGFLFVVLLGVSISMCLTRIITRPIMEAASVLAASASEISASVTQVTSGAQETATAVAQTTATVEEVKQSSHLTSQKTKAVAENSQRGLQLAQTGRKATETVADGMTRINEQMASIADTIMKLGEQSQAIGEITSTVDDIAEQSNLLAVNAAVEAAKAGEHGKGFAVVAQEIKSLAGQSKQATKQVRSILNDIQKATGAAVMATEQGSKAVDQGMKESMNANESIRALSNGFTEAVQSSGQIAASTQEQLAGMDQVAMAMESIKEASQQNVASMKQLEIAAQTLKDIGHRFTDLVGGKKG